MQASPEKTRWLEGSPTDKVLEDLTSTITRVLLESALSEVSMQGSLAAKEIAKNESDPGTSCPLNGTAQEVTASDLELYHSIVRVLGAHAHKYNYGPNITIGPQPSTDLMVPAADLYNSLSVAILTYFQTHHGWGECTQDRPCHQIFNEPWAFGRLLARLFPAVSNMCYF